MEDYEYFEGWPIWLRWFLFIPVAAIGYIVAFFLGRYIIWWSYGWFGLSETSILGYLIYGFHVNFICFFFAFVISISCVPRGRIIVQSIYLGILLFTLGFSSLSIRIYGEAKGDPTWVVVYDFILNLLAGITVLIMAIYDQKQKQQSIREKITEAVARLKIEREEQLNDPEQVKREEQIKDKLGL